MQPRPIVILPTELISSDALMCASLLLNGRHVIEYQVDLSADLSEEGPTTGAKEGLL